MTDEALTEETHPPKQQLQMVWPKDLLLSPPEVTVSAGYELRTYQVGDEAGFFKVMALAGFEGWNEDILKPWLAKILPQGWFMICHQATGEIVATAMTTHNPSELHPFGGELGWVAGHPAHAGNGLGMAVCAAVVERFIRAEYDTIYLKTDDFRLPALKVYLKLGFVPFLYAQDMQQRWRIVCDKLAWPFTPQDWPAVPDEA